MSAPRRLPRLMLVTDRRRTHGRNLAEVVRAAARGGVGIVQVREPDLDTDALRAVVEEIVGAVPSAVQVVINGEAELSRTMKLGVHLPASRPRLDVRLRPRQALYGRSAHDVEETRRGAIERCDYVILGTIHPTPSKPGHLGSGAGLIREVRERVDSPPIYAIGGITAATAPAVLRAGAHGLAVCGAILGASDPARAAQALSLAIAVGVGDARRPTVQ